MERSNGAGGARAQMTLPWGVFESPAEGVYWDSGRHCWLAEPPNGAVQEGDKPFSAREYSPSILGMEGAKAEAVRRRAEMEAVCGGPEHSGRSAPEASRDTQRLEVAKRANSSDQTAKALKDNISPRPGVRRSPSPQQAQVRRNASPAAKRSPSPVRSTTPKPGRAQSPSPRVRAAQNASTVAASKQAPSSARTGKNSLPNTARKSQSPRANLNTSKSSTQPQCSPRSTQLARDMEKKAKVIDMHQAEMKKLDTERKKIQAQTRKAEKDREKSLRALAAKDSKIEQQMMALERDALNSLREIQRLKCELDNSSLEDDHAEQYIAQEELQELQQRLSSMKKQLEEEKMDRDRLRLTNIELKHKVKDLKEQLEAPPPIRESPSPESSLLDQEPLKTPSERESVESSRMPQLKGANGILQKLKEAQECLSSEDIIQSSENHRRAKEKADLVQDMVQSYIERDIIVQEEEQPGEQISSHSILMFESLECPGQPLHQSQLSEQISSTSQLIPVEGDNISLNDPGLHPAFNELVASEAPVSDRPPSDRLPLRRWQPPPRTRALQDPLGASATVIVETVMPSPSGQIRTVSPGRACDGTQYREWLSLPDQGTPDKRQCSPMGSPMPSRESSIRWADESHNEVIRFVSDPGSPMREHSRDLLAGRGSSPVLFGAVTPAVKVLSPQKSMPTLEISPSTGTPKKFAKPVDFDFASSHKMTAQVQVPAMPTLKSPTEAVGEIPPAPSPGAPLPHYAGIPSAILSAGVFGPPSRRSNPPMAGIHRGPPGQPQLHNGTIPVTAGTVTRFQRM